MINDNLIFKADSNNLKAALNALNAGKIIIYPTDTLYSFGVDASNENAINNLNTLKNRSQPLSILLSSVDDIKEYGYLDDLVSIKISTLLPGPYTLLLKSKENKNISSLVQGKSDLIGIRVIEIEFCNNLIDQLGSPIITSSVNRHGMSSITNLDEIGHNFPELPIFYNKKNLISNGSTIIDFSRTPEKVIRVGEGKYL